MADNVEPQRKFDDMIRARFGDAIDAYARGNEHLESHAIRACYPAIAALELDESYASLVITARMDNILARIIEHGAGRQGDASELLYGSYKPLSTFSGKTNMAYFLGFITPKMLDAINCCRNIRNAYAHFDSPDDARTDKKYLKNKRKLLGLDAAYTSDCVRKLKDLADNTNATEQQIDVDGVTAVMVEICDSLSHVADATMMYAKQYKPQVIPAIYGFEMPDINVGDS